MKLLLRLMALFLITGVSNYCYCQSDSFYIEKRECNYRGVKAHKLSIVNRSQKGLIYSDFFYDFTEESKLADSIKLVLIEQLLLFEGDTSACCLSVSRYRNQMLEGCKGWPGSTSFSVQIDALFTINKLCFPIEADYYSCFPVLYDTLTNTEVNKVQEKIKHVFKEYREWYNSCKKEGHIPNYFPFNNGRYVWYGGRKSIVAKDQ